METIPFQNPVNDPNRATKFLKIIANTIIAAHGITDIFTISSSSELWVHSVYPVYIVLAVLAPQRLLYAGLFLHTVIHFAPDFELIETIGISTSMLTTAVFVGVLFGMLEKQTIPRVSVLYAYMIILHVPHHYHKQASILNQFNAMLVTIVLVVTHGIFFGIFYNADSTKHELTEKYAERIAIGTIMAHATYNLAATMPQTNNPIHTVHQINL